VAVRSPCYPTSIPSVGRGIEIVSIFPGGVEHDHRRLQAALREGLRRGNEEHAAAREAADRSELAAFQQRRAENHAELQRRVELEQAIQGTSTA